MVWGRRGHCKEMAVPVVSQRSIQALTNVGMARDSADMMTDSEDMSVAVFFIGNH